MARLKFVLALVLSATAIPAHAQSVADWAPQISSASARCGVPVAWIEGVMRAESGGRPTLDGRPIVSRTGAMGLMQLMPATWAEMRGLLSLGSDPHDPADNIVAGACYLRLMYDRFGYPGLFGAYNAGPGRYAAWLAGRGALPGETRAYLATVTAGDIARPGLGTAVSAPAPPRIFVALRSADTPRDTGAVGTNKSAEDALFLIRR